MKAYGGVGIEIHAFLTSERDANSGKFHASAALPQVPTEREDSWASGTFLSFWRTGSTLFLSGIEI
jgi:hypothetical protein